MINYIIQEQLLRNNSERITLGIIKIFQLWNFDSFTCFENTSYIVSGEKVL